MLFTRCGWAWHGGVGFGIVWFCMEWFGAAYQRIGDSMSPPSPGKLVLGTAVSGKVRSGAVWADNSG